MDNESDNGCNQLFSPETRKMNKSEWNIVLAVQLNDLNDGYHKRGGI